MADDVDPLASVSGALRAIANEDAEEAAWVLRDVESRLVLRLGTLRLAGGAPSARRRLAQGRGLGVALAATVALAAAGSLWVVARVPAPDTAGHRPAAARSEVTTAFLPLPYNAVPFTDATIVRMQVPRAALARFGLAPIEALPVDINRSDDTVLADVLVAEDGLARAVRFVRASRASEERP